MSQPMGKRAKELGASYDLTRYYNAHAKPLQNGAPGGIGTLLDSEAFDLGILYSGNIRRAAAREAQPLFCDVFDISIHMGFAIPPAFDPAGAEASFLVLTIDTEKPQTDDQYVLAEPFTDISGMFLPPLGSWGVGGRQAAKFTIRPGNRVVKFRVAVNGLAVPANTLIEMEVSGRTEGSGYQAAMILDEIVKASGENGFSVGRTPILGLRALR